jgi:hypothetical protein
VDLQKIHRHLREECQADETQSHKLVIHCLASHPAAEARLFIGPFARSGPGSPPG